MALGEARGGHTFYPNLVTVGSEGTYCDEMLEIACRLSVTTKRCMFDNGREHRDGWLSLAH